MKKCLLIAILSCTSILSSGASAAQYAVCTGNPQYAKSSTDDKTYWYCNSTAEDPWVLGDVGSITTYTNCPGANIYGAVNKNCAYSTKSMGDARSSLAASQKKQLSATATARPMAVTPRATLSGQASSDALSGAQFATCSGNPLGGTGATANWFCCKSSDPLSKTGNWLGACIQSNQVATCAINNINDSGECTYSNLA